MILNWQITSDRRQSNADSALSFFSGIVAFDSRHVLVEEGSFSSCSDGITLFYPWLHIPVEPLKSYNLEALPDFPLLCLFFSFRFPILFSRCSWRDLGFCVSSKTCFCLDYFSCALCFLFMPVLMIPPSVAFFQNTSSIPSRLLQEWRTYMVWLDGQRRKDTRLTQEQTQRTKQVKDDGNIERRERATKLHFLQRKKGFGWMSEFSSCACSSVLVNDE